MADSNPQGKNLQRKNPQDENPQGKNPQGKNPYVFGYGSLIWNPGFEFVHSERALLRGAHRSLSVYSHRHRGTVERPGLVFGLSRGGSCVGVAFEVEASKWPEVFDYLQAREQDRGVYRETVREVTLASDARLAPDDCTARATRGAVPPDNVEWT